jgi:hypothetical protein
MKQFDPQAIHTIDFAGLMPCQGLAQLLMARLATHPHADQLAALRAACRFAGQF